MREAIEQAVSAIQSSQTEEDTAFATAFECSARVLSAVQQSEIIIIYWYAGNCIEVLRKALDTKERAALDENELYFLRAKRLSFEQKVTFSKAVYEPSGYFDTIEMRERGREKLQ